MPASAVLLTVSASSFTRQVAFAELRADAPAQTLIFAAGSSRLEQSGVWLINADGSGLRRLASIGSDPSWSPDGRLIAFLSGQQWMVERTDGSGRYRVPLRGNGEVSWSADGRYLLASRVLDAAGDCSVVACSVIYSIDARSRHATRIVLRRIRGLVEGSVVSSPTGSGYAYETDNGDVWFVPLAGAPARLTEQSDGVSGVLAFSPDGTELAIARKTPNLDERVEIVPVNGGTAHTLDAPPMSRVYAAAWSPDGQTLAVNNGEQIVLARIAGAARSPHFHDVQSMSWSPDGRSLAYIDDGGLWLLDAETIARHRLADADGGSTSAWLPAGSSIAALKTVAPSAIPRADSSTGSTLRTSGPVKGISLRGTTVVVNVAASRLYCERMLSWRPGGATAVLPFRGPPGDDGCKEPFGILGFAASRDGVLIATASGGLEGLDTVWFAGAGRARARIIAHFGSTVGGFGTSVISGRAAGDLLAFTTAYVCAGPEVTNGAPYRCPRGIPEGTVTHSSLFVVRNGRAVTVRRVPYPMRIYDASAGRILLGEAPHETPGAASTQSALVIDTDGLVLSSTPLPRGTRGLRLSGRDIVIARPSSLELLTQAGETLASYRLPIGGRLVGAAGGLAAIITPNSLRIMRLSDGRSITLLHSTQIDAKVSAAGIAYSYRLTSGLRRGRVVFVPLRTLQARLR